MRRRLTQLAERSDTAGHVTERELLTLYLEQECRCAISGRLLRPSARLGDPDGISLILRDPTRRVYQRNLLLVTTCVAECVNRWGLDEFITLAQDVHASVKRTRKRR